MKRVLLTLVALVALLTVVETAKADWVFVTNNGWGGWWWDPAFDDGTFDGPPSPIPTHPPPTSRPYTIHIDDMNIFWAILN